jgi:hypothetical protein
MDFPDWGLLDDLAIEVVAAILEMDPEYDDKARKNLRERAGVVAPRKPALGYVISRAIAHVRSELRGKHHLIIDEKKKGVPAGRKVYRLFKRQEVVGDVEHQPDQLLVFDKKGEEICLDDSSLDDDVLSLLQGAINHVKEFTAWRDVREFADRALGASGAVRTELGYIVLPQVYEKVDSLADIFDMMGVKFDHFKIAPEDRQKTNELIKESLVDEFDEIFQEVDEAVATLEKQKCIRDRLKTLERVRSRVALYAAVLGDVQDGLLGRIEQAESSVNERLGEFD